MSAYSACFMWLLIIVFYDRIWPSTSRGLTTRHRRDASKNTARTAALIDSVVSPIGRAQRVSFFFFLPLLIEVGHKKLTFLRPEKCLLRKTKIIFGISPN